MKDPALSMCDPATRGVWIDLLCAIHELDHAGQVTGTPEQLSRLCRCSVAQFVDALSEIRLTRSADVSERNGIVTVTSRRMKRDSVEREKTNERVKKHRCNAVVTDSETQMKQDSSSSSSSSLKKSSKLLKKSPPPPFSENQEISDRGSVPAKGVPDEVSVVIGKILDIRCRTAYKQGKIVKRAGLEATLKQAYISDPEGEMRRWQEDISEDDRLGEEAERKRFSEKKKRDEELSASAESNETRRKIRIFEKLGGDERDKIISEARKSAEKDGILFAPNTMSLTPWICQILDDMTSLTKESA